MDGLTDRLRQTVKSLEADLWAAGGPLQPHQGDDNYHARYLIHKRLAEALGAARTLLTEEEFKAFVADSDIDGTYKAVGSDVVIPTLLRALYATTREYEEWQRCGKGKGELANSQAAVLSAPYQLMKEAWSQWAQLRALASISDDDYDEVVLDPRATVAVKHLHTLVDNPAQIVPFPNPKLSPV